MAKILIIYSTTDGHTRKICEYLRQIIEGHAHLVKIASLDDEADIDLAAYDTIVVGASIRYGKHQQQVYQFIERNVKLLGDRKNAFFSVNLVARKPGKDQAHTNPYVKKFLKQITWKPAEIAIFAGKIDYPKYSYWDRLIIRLIMKITKGPTDPDTVKEFTNWEQVAEFGQKISAM